MSETHLKVSVLTFIVVARTVHCWLFLYFFPSESIDSDCLKFNSQSLLCYLRALCSYSRTVPITSVCLRSQQYSVDCVVGVAYSYGHGYESFLSCLEHHSVASDTQQ